ncbi:MAG: 5'-3' exonuclease [Mycoplasmataceae bacterium]|jgi:DNA polymerase-1|nr:5'-3' exonuclease [Mycoplasmataceae bacterium]
MPKKAIVIDGNSLIYRAFYATGNQLAYYKSHNLPPVNALKLVLLIILKLVHETEYDYALVAFDHQKKTLRHDTFADYKAGRKPMPEELVYQLPLIKEAVDIIGIKNISMEGIEADDLIGSFVKIMNKDNVEVEIYSSDRDMLQLVNDKTVVKLFKTGISDIQTVSLKNFSEIFHGLTPQQVIDFKGISGDSSDNLCGIRGVGPTTASALIKQYHSLDGIYASLDQLSPALQSKFNHSKETAYMCRNLSIIQTNSLDDKILNYFIKQPTNKRALRNLIYKYHFTGLDKYLDDIQSNIFE